MAEKLGLQRRFFEIRQEGDRTLTGTAMVYGDVAELPWGEKERFMPGAFGDVSKLDVILNVQHNRDKPIARTKGGGLELVDSRIELVVRAELPETPDADNVLVLRRNKILRGMSIEFYPKRYEIDEATNTIVHHEAELRNIGVVDRPAYTKAKLDPRHSEDNMDREDIQKMIDDALASRSDDGTLDTSALAEAIITGMKDANTQSVRDQIDAALKERDEAQDAAKKAEAEKAEAERTATEERAKLEANAEARADLIVQVRELLPDDFDTKGKTRHEILVAAAGQEVEDAEKRSEDYLLAKVEGIAERRQSATSKTSTRSTVVKPNTRSKGPVNINRLISRRKAQAAKHAVTA